jgi:uncharacterized surface protein with fasciclin (FAS1) repeats
MKLSFCFFLLSSVLCTTVAQEQQQNVYQVALGLPETFSRLVRAVMAANLVGALEDPNLGSTVFAPTNDAFAALNALNLPSANTVTLFRDPAWQPHLQDLLLYHVLPGSQVLAEDVTDGLTVTMLNGENVTFSVSQEDGTVSVNSVATVVAADVPASNGQWLFGDANGLTYSRSFKNAVSGLSTTRTPHIICIIVSRIIFIVCCRCHSCH